MGEMKFADWIAELNRLAVERRLATTARPLTADTGTDCWRLLWEDGLTPDEALEEEGNYE